MTGWGDGQHRGAWKAVAALSCITAGIVVSSGAVMERGRTASACVAVLHDADHTSMDLAGADYSGGAWSFEDTGYVFGYSAQEDSTIWATRECARSQERYR